MRIEDAIELLASWLEIDRVSAAERTTEALENNLQKERGVLGPYCGNLGLAALHESAHAVAAIRGDFLVRRVCLRADGSGAVEHGDAAPDVEQTIDVMIRMVTVDLAGLACELLTGVDVARQSALAHSFDVLQASTRIKACRERMPDWTLTGATFATMTLCTVASNIRAIERLAIALHALGELDGEEVRALCGHMQ